MLEAYFSTDIEADGPIPGPYSMSSLGVALAGYRTSAQEIVRVAVDDAQPTYYAELRPISDKFVPEAAAVSGLDRDELIRTGQNPIAAMVTHNAWVNQVCAELAASTGEKTRPVFAAYPLGYDVLFFQWYVMNFAGFSPYGHSTHFDAKTAFAVKAGRHIVGATKRNMPKELLSKRKHTHNALDDAREQGEMIMNIMMWDGAA